MYLNRLIREDRDRQIERVSEGKEYSAVENEISDIEVVAVSTTSFPLYFIISNLQNVFRIVTWPI